MTELYNKLKSYNIEKAIKLEESDKQFLALKNLSKSILDSELYLLLTIFNSIICYQLSWKWEDYWWEFSEYFCKNNPNKNNLLNDFVFFLKQSKNNKRLLEIKIKRLIKMEKFIYIFEKKAEFYYKNMTILRNDLAILMNQKRDAKTIVFAVKMFWYAARNIYDFEIYPKDIFIPIDSRLIKIFSIYKWNYIDINKFYIDLSKKLNIPMLHLDWILWSLYFDLVKND